MSTIKTNAIQTVAGKPILNSTGSILQVVQTAKTDTSAYAATANTYAEFDSAFRVSITPSSSSNKILIGADVSGGQTTGSLRYKFQFSTNGGSSWSDVSPIANTVSSHGIGHFVYAVNADGNQAVTCSMTILHSPATTSAIIYRVLFGQDVSTTYYFNRSVSYPDSFLGGTYTSIIRAMEVSA
jgi:hypothetical protein